MNTATNSEVFFFISSVGFVFLWILIAILLAYLIRIMHTFSRIMKKVEKDIDRIGDATEDVLWEIKESRLFQFIFGKQHRHKKTKE
ncbi:MAG: DUF948 domain-containing protein [bacterium]